MAGMFEHGAKTDSASTATFKSQLNKVYSWYAGGFVGFVIVLGILEQGELKGKRIGSSWRIRRPDLDAYLAG